MSRTGTDPLPWRPWRFQHVEIEEFHDPQTVKASLDLGFGIRVQRLFELRHYIAPTRDNVPDGGGFHLVHAAELRLSEILEEIHGHDLEVELLTYPGRRRFEWEADLKIQQVGGRWVDLADILIEEGWGLLGTSVDGKGLFFSDEPYPIPVGDERRRG